MMRVVMFIAIVCNEIVGARNNWKNCDFFVPFIKNQYINRTLMLRLTMHI